jgi:hypothetical protein
MQPRARSCSHRAFNFAGRFASQQCREIPATMPSVHHPGRPRHEQRQNAPATADRSPLSSQSVGCPASATMRSWRGTHPCAAQGRRTVLVQRRRVGSSVEGLERRRVCRAMRRTFAPTQERLASPWQTNRRGYMPHRSATDSGLPTWLRIEGRSISRLSHHPCCRDTPCHIAAIIPRSRSSMPLRSDPSPQSDCDVVPGNSSRR